jgi:hypothetical protein
MLRDQAYFFDCRPAESGLDGLDSIAGPMIPSFAVAPGLEVGITAEWNSILKRYRQVLESDWRAKPQFHIPQKSERQRGWRRSRGPVDLA